MDWIEAIVTPTIQRCRVSFDYQIISFIHPTDALHLQQLWKRGSLTFGFGKIGERHGENSWIQVVLLISDSGSVDLCL
jgi:hypothetical protein